MVRIELVKHDSHLFKLIGLGLEVCNDGADARLEGGSLTERGKVGTDVELCVAVEDES